jgi:hypothetical protein
VSRLGTTTAGTWLERLAVVLVALVLAVGLIGILSGFFQSRDQPGVSGNPNDVVGLQFRDLGHAYLVPGAPRPAYDSIPPTSGAHIPAPVTHDAAQLSDDQLLQALELGDVVIVYGSPAPPLGLQALARGVAGPFTPALASAGQAVITARRPGTSGLIGLAWTRMVRVRSPSDPSLRDFASQWLGHGALRR